MKNILVACVCHSICGDQRIGSEVYDELQKAELPEHVRVELLSCSGLTLLDEINGENTLIVVNAANTKGVPGTVTTTPWQQLDVMDKHIVNLIEVGLAETMQICRELYPERLPQNAYAIDVEGEVFDRFDVDISPVVREGILGAVDAVKHLCTAHQAS